MWAGYWSFERSAANNRQRLTTQVSFKGGTIQGTRRTQNEYRGCDGHVELFLFVYFVFRIIFRKTGGRAASFISFNNNSKNDNTHTFASSCKKYKIIIIITVPANFGEHDIITHSPFTQTKAFDWRDTLKSASPTVVVALYNTFAECWQLVYIYIYICLLCI